MAMLRCSGAAARPMAGSTTPKVVQLMPTPTRMPKLKISIGSDDALAQARGPRRRRPRRRRRSARAVPIGGGTRQRLGEAQTRLCSATAKAIVETGKP